MSFFSHPKHSRLPIKKEEWLLLLAPFLVIVALIVWGLAPSRKVEKDLEKAPVQVMAAQFFGKNQILGLGAASGAGTGPHVLVWDAQTRQLNSDWTAPMGTRALQPSPDGRFYAALDGVALWVRDVASHSPVAQFPLPPVEKFDWTPQGQFLLVGGPRPTLFDPWNGATPRVLPIAVLFAPKSGSWPGLEKAVFSPDGKKVAFLESLSVPASPPLVSPLLPSPATTLSGPTGGRLIVASWPALQPMAILPGDLFKEVVWTPAGDLVAVARLMDGPQTLEWRVFQVPSADFGTGARGEKLVSGGQWHTLEAAPDTWGIGSESVVVSPDGQWAVRSAAQGAGGAWLFWHTANGRLAGRVDVEISTSLPPLPAFSSDSARLVSPHGSQIEIKAIAGSLKPM